MNAQARSLPGKEGRDTDPARAAAAIGVGCRRGWRGWWIRTFVWAFVASGFGFCANGAEAGKPATIVPDQPCSIYLAIESDLALADDNGLCSFKPANENKPLRFKI